MAKYAATTTVAPERSRAEIERILSRYGASAFSYGWDGDRAAIAFRAAGRAIRFEIAVPRMDEFLFTKAKARRAPGQQKIARDQAERQRWRALVLIINAKLEAIDSGVTTFESEFLAHVVLPNGSTVGDWFAPQLNEVYENGEMPALMPTRRQIEA